MHEVMFPHLVSDSKKVDLGTKSSQSSSFNGLIFSSLLQKELEKDTAEQVEISTVESRFDSQLDTGWLGFDSLSLMDTSHNRHSLQEKNSFASQVFFEKGRDRDRLPVKKSPVENQATEKHKRPEKDRKSTVKRKENDTEVSQAQETTNNDEKAVNEAKTENSTQQTDEDKKVITLGSQEGTLKKQVKVSNEENEVEENSDENPDDKFEHLKKIKTLAASRCARSDSQIAVEQEEPVEEGENSTLETLTPIGEDSQISSDSLKKLSELQSESDLQSVSLNDLSEASKLNQKKRNVSESELEMDNPDENVEEILSSQHMDSTELESNSTDSLSDEGPTFVVQFEQALSYEKFSAGNTIVDTSANDVIKLNSNKSYDSESDKLNSGVTEVSIKTESKASDSSASSKNEQGLGFGYSQETDTLKGSVLKESGATLARSSFAELLEQAKLLKAKDGKQVLSLELRPKDLGRLEMELASKDGTLFAKISAENEIAKARLEELLPRIQEQLFLQGISLEEIKVDISSKNPDYRNSANNFSGKAKNKSVPSLEPERIKEVQGRSVSELRRSALFIKAVDLTV